jgi:isoleucyl-tRNA synthetase
MITNASPWDNLKFDISGIEEITRKFFGTLYNTYSFFALYANVDGFTFKERKIPEYERPEIDRWIISLLNSLVIDVKNCYNTYEPTKAGRLISDFVTENLSNWYVRLNRKRFWGGEYSKDKMAAYQTLYECLVTVSKLAAPIAPFYLDKIFLDLNKVTRKYKSESVHLLKFPLSYKARINYMLEERMKIAQSISSMVLSLRRRVNIKVRQPLSLIKVIPVNFGNFDEQFDAVKNLILSETNVKEAIVIKDLKGTAIKKGIKLDYKKLGPLYGNKMKQIAFIIDASTQEQIFNFENVGSYTFDVDGQNIQITNKVDSEVITLDIPGSLVASEENLTIILDTTMTEDLRQEGIAREFINRIQNIRKDSGFDVTDKIHIKIQKHEAINEALDTYKNYIAGQTLATELKLVDALNGNNSKVIEIDDDIQTLIMINRI